MDSVERYAQVVCNLLQEYAIIPTSEGADAHYEVILDGHRHRYLLLAIGWSQGQRVHHTVIHIDIIEGQVWIQANNTDRLIAEELVKVGIPHQSIVLGLQPPEIRPYTDYGVPEVSQHAQSLVAQS